MTIQQLYRWVGLFGTGLTVLSAACYSASLDESSTKPVGAKAQEIIGGFSANSSELDAVGSLNIAYIYGYSEYVCTAVLIGETTALTARQCADSLSYRLSPDARAVFSIGPYASSPSRQVDVVHYELAPATPDGTAFYDLAVLHFDQPITDIAPLPWSAIDPAAIGKQFVGIGYGIQNTNYVRGTRKLGALTLRATSGRVYEQVFGSFEAYFKWYTGFDLPSECDGGDTDAGAPQPTGGKGGRGGSGGKGGTGGFGPPDDYLCQLAYDARQYYDNELLAPGARVYAGGLAEEAQPCDGDGGGPLLRRDTAGQLTVYGIMSYGFYNNGICDFGALYSAFDATALSFIARANDWVDPCGDLSSTGLCSGSVAQRCSALGEGPRRKLSFDCTLVGLSCEIQNDGSVGCGADDTYFRPEFGPIPASAPDVNTQIFHAPIQP